MKLKDWAIKQGISYTTAYRWFQDGQIPNAYQAESGTILVDENGDNNMFKNMNNMVNKFNDMCDNFGLVPSIYPKNYMKKKDSNYTWFDWSDLNNWNVFNSNQFMNTKKELFNIAIENNKYIITAEIPGFDENNIKITAKLGILNISGKKEYKENERKQSIETFEKQYNLPDIDPNNISAVCKNGILTITVFKLPENKDIVEVSVPINK